MLSSYVYKKKEFIQYQKLYLVSDTKTLQWKRRVFFFGKYISQLVDVIMSQSCRILTT